MAETATRAWSGPLLGGAITGSLAFFAALLVPIALEVDVTPLVVEGLLLLGLAAAAGTALLLRSRA